MKSKNEEASSPGSLLKLLTTLFNTVCRAPQCFLRELFNFQRETFRILLCWINLIQGAKAAKQRQFLKWKQTAASVWICLYFDISKCQKTIVPLPFDARAFTLRIMWLVSNWGFWCLPTVSPDYQWQFSLSMLFLRVPYYPEITQQFGVAERRGSHASWTKPFQSAKSTSTSKFSNPKFHTKCQQ